MNFLIKHKDVISTYAGLIAAITGGILFVSSQYTVPLPSFISIPLVILCGVSVGMMGVLIGKTPSLPVPNNQNNGAVNGN